jgi:hypothetical protein
MPAMPARRLGQFLADWQQFGAVDVAPALQPMLDEWHALERAAAEDRMAIYLQPIAGARPDACDERPPGADVFRASS